MLKQRKLRSKLSFDEDEQGADNPPPPPPSDITKLKKDSSKPRKSALLSFGDDEESAVAPAKAKKDKSKVSKFHRGGTAATVPTAAAAAARPASPGEYSAEKLAALHAATQKLPAKYKPPPAAAADTAAAAAAATPAGGFKLSGSFKPAVEAKDDRYRYSYNIQGQITSDKDLKSNLPPVPTQKSSSNAAAAAAAAGKLAAAVAAAAIQDPEADGEAMPLPPPPRPGSSSGRAIPAAAAAAAEHGSDSEEEGGDDGGFLPNEETIRLAKAKRERLRQAHLAPDYVPLGGASRLLNPGGLGSSSSTLAGSSRVRSDRVLTSGQGIAGDQGLSGDDDQGLGGAGSGSDQKGSGSREGSDADEDLEDTYRMRFVGLNQQGSAASQDRQGSRSGSRSDRRAAAAAARSSGQYTSEVVDLPNDDHDDLAAAAAADPLARAIRRNAAAGQAVNGSSSSWLTGRGRGVSDRMEIIRSAGSDVLAALLEASSRAAGRQKHLESNLARTAANLQNAVQEAERVRADIAAASEKYAAVQSLKAYLSDLADCLAAKAPLVEELQDSLEQAREEAAAALRQQQQSDDQILFDQAEAAVAAALAVLGNGGAPAAAAAAAENAAAEAHEAAVAAAAAGGGDLDQDEFGRDMGLWRRKELEKGRVRRDQIVQESLSELQRCRQGGRLDVETSATPAAAAAAANGSSSSMAAAPEALQSYSRRRQEILDLTPTVFADTDQQYSSLNAVKTRLEDFKAQYPREYNTAYIGDSAGALFAPFVRLELLRWEPLPIAAAAAAGSSDLAAAATEQQQQQGAINGVNHAGFDTQEWYQQLFEYGLAAAAAAAGDAAAAADDADANLVPQLVESLILPMALHLVAKCWDPSNVAQSKAIVSLVSDLFVYVPAENEDMAQLLALTTGSLEAAAATAVVPPWPSAAAAASPIAQALLNLRFTRCTAVLRGLTSFQDLLSQQLMTNLALQGLVSGQLVPCLRSCLGDLGLAVARAEAVVQSLPSACFSKGATPREAQPLIDVVGSLARSIEQQMLKQGGSPGGQESGFGAAGLAGLAARVVPLLVHVGLRDQAQRLGQLCGAK